MFSVLFWFCPSLSISLGSSFLNVVVLDGQYLLLDILVSMGYLWLSSASAVTNSSSWSKQDDKAEGHCGIHYGEP